MSCKQRFNTWYACLFENQASLHHVVHNSCRVQLVFSVLYHLVLPAKIQLMHSCCVCVGCNCCEKFLSSIIFHGKFLCSYVSLLFSCIILFIVRVMFVMLTHVLCVASSCLARQRFDSCTNAVFVLDAIVMGSCFAVIV